MHSGNMLFVESNESNYQWQIGDFGLSQPASNSSINNEIYGVIPYIAPEIFNGALFSKESDIYRYISKEHEYDINTQSSSLVNKSSNIQYQDVGYANFSLNEYTSKELEFDISRQPAIDVKSTTQNASNTLHQSVTYNISLNSSISSENSSRKRDIEESEINSQVNSKQFHIYI
ncbi:13570_t:CDS:2 [Funneliformis geosporum]|uniref:13570_t:CDS:1 n=1 Tax=Funneliformis geosporum TaxID=1117311 RepID=A0A9W4WU54_9GLOM|nr:13570_t:CDS:2 [Funneliformis geosporum]